MMKYRYSSEKQGLVVVQSNLKIPVPASYPIFVINKRDQLPEIFFVPGI